MLRYLIVISACLLSVFVMEGHARCVIVADSVTHAPLPNATIFDRHGNAIAICDSNGKMPYISDSSYPITVRYLEFNDVLV